MAPKRKDGEVAGFDVVRAMKKAREGKGSAPPPPKKPPASPAATPDQPDDKNKGTRAKVGRTAVPTKHIYTCYECGYEFTISGVAHSLYCSKCRTILNQKNFNITKRHDEAIKTAGVVTIEPEGIWKGKPLAARDVILKGRHESGDIKAFRQLEVYPGAVVQLDQVETGLLIVHAGVVLKPDQPLQMKNVELFGTLDGDITTTERMTIHPGGHVKGKLRTKYITIEEGGGLTAHVAIGEDAVIEKKKPAKEKEKPEEELLFEKSAIDKIVKMAEPEVKPAEEKPVPKKAPAKKAAAKKAPAKPKRKPPTKKAGESEDPPA